MVNEEKFPDINKDLEMSVGDYAHAGVKAALSTAPFLGGPLAEFTVVARRRPHHPYQQAPARAGRSQQSHPQLRGRTATCRAWTGARARG